MLEIYAAIIGASLIANKLDSVLCQDWDTLIEQSLIWYRTDTVTLIFNCDL